MAGETQSHSDFATFVVTVTLTEKGNGHVDEIVPLVFSCLAMIRAAPPARWVFDEIGGLSRMRLRFLDTIEPAQAVLHLSREVRQVNQPRHALVSSFLYDEWAPDEITALLEQLTPHRMIIHHIAPLHVACASQRERWYGTAYSDEPLSAALLAACTAPPKIAALRWPAPNVFVPTQFDLICDGQPEVWAKVAKVKAAAGKASTGKATAGKAGGGTAPAAGSDAAATLAAALASRGELLPPTLLQDESLVEVWHKIDRTFRRPKTNLNLDVVAPAAYASAGAAILSGILFRMLSDELTEFAYPAECAGLTYMAKRHSTGFYITAEGHSHKLPLLLTRVLERIASPTLEAERFAVQHEQELKSVRSWLRAQPREHARYASAHLLDGGRWHVLEYLDFLADDAACTRDGLLELHAALRSRIRVTALCHGNTDSASAVKMVAEAAKALGGQPLALEQLPDPRCLMLPDGVDVVLRSHRSFQRPEHAQWLNVDETNCAVEVTLQGEMDSRPASQIVEL